MMLSPKCAVRGNPFLSLRSTRIAMATLYLAAALLLCLPGLGVAFNFPPLTGRVVDQAGIMTAQSRSELEAKLKNLEDKSGIQVVVATVKSLEGSDIETYANQLFRNWRLGEAKKNNGVLLLVAPNEHKVRIEVGYGLEGTLTDALSSVIISSAMVPRFKANDFSGGIERGVDGIISVLSGDTTDWQPKPSVRAEDPPPLPNELFTILFVLIAIFVILSFPKISSGQIRVMRQIGASSDAMLAIFHLLWTVVANSFKSQRRLELEKSFSSASTQHCIEASTTPSAVPL